MAPLAICSQISGVTVPTYSSFSRRTAKRAGACAAAPAIEAALTTSSTSSRNDRGHAASSPDAPSAMAPLLGVALISSEGGWRSQQADRVSVASSSKGQVSANVSHIARKTRNRRLECARMDLRCYQCSGAVLHALSLSTHPPTRNRIVSGVPLTMPVRRESRLSERIKQSQRDGVASGGSAQLDGAPTP